MRNPISRLPFGSPTLAIKAEALNATKVKKEEKRSDSYWRTRLSHFQRLHYICHGVGTGHSINLLPLLDYLLAPQSGAQ